MADRFTLKRGGRYNFVAQPERLIYLGDTTRGNGCWHQFALVESPRVVWAEVRDADLWLIEETKEPAHG